VTTEAAAADVQVGRGAQHAPINKEALTRSPDEIGGGGSLLAAVGGNYDPKLFKQLSQALLTLSLSNKHLFAAAAEPLDVGVLLGRGVTRWTRRA
jgi:hypothetical protein